MLFIYDTFYFKMKNLHLKMFPLNEFILKKFLFCLRTRQGFSCQLIHFYLLILEFLLKFIYFLFIFGCTGSLLLRVGVL